MSDQILLPGAGVSLAEKVELAIENLRFWEHIALMHNPEGYHLCYSGGKDSGVILALAKMAGVKHTVNYNVTTIDPPELARFVRTSCPETKWDRYKRPFFAMIPTKGLPTRRFRWCCELYKERGGIGSVKILGVRAAESASRKAEWKLLTRWKRGDGWALNPILYWTDEDVWDFTSAHGLPYCCLYDEGFKRLGCIGCPMAREKGRRMEFARWPRYERLWRKAAAALWTRRAGTRQRDGREWFGSAHFNGPDEMFEWWLSDKSLPRTAEQDSQMWDWVEQAEEDERAESEDCGMGLW